MAGVSTSTLNIKLSVEFNVDLIFCQVYIIVGKQTKWLF